jgi:hypothetical protein
MVPVAAGPVRRRHRTLLRPPRRAADAGRADAGTGGAGAAPRRPEDRPWRSRHGRGARGHARRCCGQAAHRDRTGAGVSAALAGQDAGARRLWPRRAGRAACRQGPALDDPRYGPGKARGARLAGAGARGCPHGQRGAQARRCGAPQGHAQPATGALLAGRLRLRPCRLVPRPRRRRRRRGCRRDRGRRARPAPVPAARRGRRPRAPGHRRAHPGGVARRDGRHRQRTDHRRARRHRGSHQPSVPRLRAVPHPVHLGVAYGDHGGRGVPLHSPHAGRDPGDRAPIPHQEMGRGRRHAGRLRLSADLRRGVRHGALLHHDLHHVPGGAARPPSHRAAQRGAGGAGHPDPVA